MEALADIPTVDLVAAALQGLLVAAALATAGVYAIKRSGNRSANVFFALTLAAFALSIGALVLEHLGLTTRSPRLRYLPVWMTWTIGPAWFYYVKFSLFPAYRFRWTDLKHFAAPLAQVLFYLGVFLSGRTGLAPDRLLGVEATTLDEAVFLASVVGYLFAGYRYLRYRARRIGQAPRRWDFWKVRLLRRSQRVLFVLLTFNFAFVAVNFLSAHTLGQELMHVRSYYATSSLSFGLILLYLLRGVAYRQHFYPQVPSTELTAEGPLARVRELVEREGGFRDPDLHPVRVARAVGISPGTLEGLSPKLGAPDWPTYIARLRFAEVSRLRKTGLTLRVAALEAGFASRRAVQRAFARRAKRAGDVRGGGFEANGQRAGVPQGRLGDVAGVG